MFKNAMATVLAGIILIVSLAGCNNSATSGKVDFETAPTVYFARRNVYEAKIGKSGDSYIDNAYIHHIYDKTGIRVAPVLLASNISEANQQLAVKRAGGEKLDIFVDYDISQIHMQSNLIIPLNDIFKKYADKIQGYNPFEENTIDKVAWGKASKLGVYWAIPSRGIMPKAKIKYFFFRKDWLDKLGLKMPTNTDELGEVFRAFTEDDPDGNGIKDTYGMPHNGTNLVNEMLITMGVDSWLEYIVNENGEIDENGTNLVCQSMHPKARKAFVLLRKWHKSGYFQEDGIADSKAYMECYSNNKAGVYLGFIDDLIKITNNLKENGQPEAEWVLCTNKIICSLDNQFYGWKPAGNVGLMTMITSMASESNYENIFKLLNWSFSKEGTTFQSYGLPGREYNEIDGKFVEDVDYINNYSYVDLFNFGKSYDLYFKDQALRYYGDTPLGRTYIDQCINNYDNYVTKRTDVKFLYSDLSEYTTYPDWRKGVESYLLKFVVGDADPMDDATWNAYIKECEQYGIQKLMDSAAKVHFKK